MGKTVKLISGNEIDMTMCSFDEGQVLLDACLKEIDGIAITEKTDHIDVFKKIVARAILSPDIKKALKPCLDRTIYKDTKLSDFKIFEDEVNRRDYLPIVKEVLAYNLTPFFADLILGLRDIEGQLRALQKPK